MPVSYPIPPWLSRDYDPAQKFVQGMQLGASISQERAKLNQQAATTQMETQVKAEQSQRNALLEQQQNEVQAAYHQQQIDLQQRELEQKQQQVKMQTDEAARTFQAQQQYKTNAQNLIDQGVDDNEAYLRAAMSVGPMMGITGPAMASMGRTLAEMNASDDGTQEPIIKQLDIGGGRQRPVAYIPGSKAFRFADEDMTSTGSQVAQPIKDEAGNALPGKYAYGRQVISVPDEVAAMEKRLDRKEKEQSADSAGAAAAEKPPKDLNAAAKAAAKSYKARQDEIDELKKSIEERTKKKTGKTDYSGKRLIWNPKTRRLEQAQ
jgi:hypothetical protein